MTKYFVLQRLHKIQSKTTLYYIFCIKHFPIPSLVLQTLHRTPPNTTLYYKACTKSVPVLLCTTKLAQSTSQYFFCTTKFKQSMSQYFFVIQSLHKVHPNIALYYIFCAKHFPIPSLVLQTLHRTLPNTTLYYKAYTKSVLVLLCTTRLAQNTSQYYFIQQGLHKVRPSTTLYYKACTKHFPIPFFPPPPLPGEGW